VSGKIKCAVIWVGWWEALQLFLFCEALGFFLSFLTWFFMVCTVVLALLVTFSKQEPCLSSVKLNVRMSSEMPKCKMNRHGFCLVLAVCKGAHSLNNACVSADKINYFILYSFFNSSASESFCFKAKFKYLSAVSLFDGVRSLNVAEPIVIY
jgi:hypothetical protein